MKYYDPHYEDTYEEVPDTQEGEMRNWPDCEGAWKLLSTGETAIASETIDIEDRPMFTIMIDGDGPFFGIDLEDEQFVKL